MNKRSYFRVRLFQTDVHVSYKTATRSVLYLANIRDISANGISVWSDSPFENLQIGGYVVVSFQIQNESFRLPAKLVRMEKEQGKQYVYAFQYTALGVRTEEQLLRLLLRIDIQRGT